jgi:ABC-type nitrate/sulfonate/bicarbonate transport system substrate-binding protein
MKVQAVGFFALVAAILLFGPSDFKLLPGAGAAEKLEKIRVVHSNRGGSQAIAAGVHDAGLFRKHGLDVEMIFVSGTLSIKSLLSGEVQMAIAAGPPVVRARLAGADLVLIIGILNTMDHVVFARGVSRMDQLKGKHIGVSTFGALDDVSARYLLKKFGLQPDQDVAIIQLGSQTVRIAALQSGSVHATLLQPPLTASARKMGFLEIASLGELGLAYQGAAVVTTSAFVKQHEDLVRRFAKAFVEGIHFYKTNKEASIRSIGRFMQLKDREALEETYQHYALKMTPSVPYPSVEGIRNILSDLERENPKAKTADSRDFLDLRFVKELEASGFISQLYGK